MDLPFLLPVRPLLSHFHLCVSILVLMDLPFLPQEQIKATIERAESFNPCSYGSSVLTDERNESNNCRARRFQSLFLWIFRSYEMEKKHW